MSDQEPKNSNPPTPKTRHWIVEHVISFGVAVLIVFMVRSSIFEAFKIPSGSMIPTLLVGDHIFVNKFAYGFKIPFSDISLPDYGIKLNPKFLAKREPPKRGDVIVFLYPKDENFFYIKRVVGIPGDLVEIKDKTLFVNNQEVPKQLVTGAEADKVFSGISDERFTSQSISVYKENLFGVEHYILHDKNKFVTDDHGPFQVPAESLFVMGDNRDFSADSRYWGYVPYDNVKGKAMVIWLSMWISFSDGQSTFKPTRTGIVIH